MKSRVNIFLISLIAFCFFQCNSVTENKTAQIKFEATEYDFGELELNADGNCSFDFSNSGETPLVIQNVKTSCGCTVPQWPKKPIKPGKSGTVEIIYDTSHPGMFSKTVTVFYNGQDSPLSLTIKGSVLFPQNSES